MAVCIKNIQARKTFSPKHLYRFHLFLTFCLSFLFLLPAVWLATSVSTTHGCWILLAHYCRHVFSIDCHKHRSANRSRLLVGCADQNVSLQKTLLSSLFPRKFIKSEIQGKFLSKSRKNRTKNREKKTLKPTSKYLDCATPTPHSDILCKACVWSPHRQTNERTTSYRR